MKNKVVTPDAQLILQGSYVSRDKAEGAARRLGQEHKISCRILPCDNGTYRLEKQ